MSFYFNELNKQQLEESTGFSSAVMIKSVTG